MAFETLFDPAGNVAASSLIATNQSGVGHVEVHNPMAGTWTAVIFTVSNAPHFGSPIQFTYQTEQFHPAGSVAPSSATLKPGQTAMFTVKVTAGQAGDEGLKLRLGTGSSNDGSIPIIIRSLVPLSPGGGSFSGSLTGGGATGNAGQSFTYQFNVQGNKPSLNVGIQLADSGYNLNGFLMDPNGQPLDAQSTAAFDANDNFLGFGRTMQFFHGSPANGLWTLVLNVAGPGDGAHLSEPFTGSVSFGPRCCPRASRSRRPSRSRTPETAERISSPTRG